MKEEMMKKKNEEKLVNGETLDELLDQVPENDKLDLVSETEQLQNKINELEEELATAKNDYYKAYADAENTKKRLRQDFDMHNKYRLQSFASDILPAIDNLERALESTDKESPLYQGVEMIYRQLLEALRKEGVEEIKAVGEKFDPQVHDGIMTEAKEGVESGIVLEELQKGYKIKDRVLRATLVKVSE